MRSQFFPQASVLVAASCLLTLSMFLTVLGWSMDTPALVLPDLSDASEADIELYVEPRLATDPVGDVSVSITSSDPAVAFFADSRDSVVEYEAGDGFGTESILQVVDDTVLNTPPKRVTLTYTVDAGSSPEYEGLSATLEVVLADDDDPGTGFSSPRSIFGREGETTDNVLRLTTQPQSDVVLEVVSLNPAILAPTVSRFTFTPANYNEFQTFTLEFFEDDDVYGFPRGNNSLLRFEVVDSLSDPNWAGVRSQSPAVTLIDNDTMAINTSVETLTVAEGAGDSFDITLAAEPRDGFLTVIDRDGGIVNPFNTNVITTIDYDVREWDEAQTLNFVTEDNDRIGTEEARILLSLSLTIDSRVSSPVSKFIPVTIIDDEVASIVVGTIATDTLSTDDATQVPVSLPGEPVGDVVILVSTSTDALTADTTELLFTPANWDTPQLVTVTATADEDTLDTASLLELVTDDTRSPGGWENIAASTEFTSLDTDVVAPVLDATTLDIFEDTVDRPVAVTLSHRPTAPVTVQLVSSDTDTVILDAPTLEFTPANWNVPQTVLVSGVADTDDLASPATLTATADTQTAELPILVNEGTDDLDGDGIPTYLEAAGPNAGDGNNDGVPDSEQSDVTSLPTLDSAYLVLDGQGCDLSSITLVSESELSSQDPAYDYPHGLVDFVGNCSLLDLEGYLYETPTSVLRKFDVAYTTIDTATVSETLVGTQSVLRFRYQVRDGGALDTSPAGDGVVRDPVGFGVPVQITANPDTRDPDSPVTDDPSSPTQDAADEDLGDREGSALIRSGGRPESWFTHPLLLILTGIAILSILSRRHPHPTSLQQ